MMQNAKKTRKLIQLIGMIIILVSGCSPNQAVEEATPTPLPTPIVPTKPTYTVQRGEVLSKIQFVGRVSPIVEEEAFFRSGGRVRNIYAKKGDQVTQGQILADMEGIDNIERQLELYQLNQRRAEIYAEIAQYNLDIFKQTTPSWTKGYAEQLAIKERELELAEISKQEAIINAQDLADQVEAMTLKAPIAGELLSFNVTPGKVIDAFQSVAVVADMANLEVSAELLSDDMNDLVEGMPVTAVLSNRPGEVITGEIRRLPYPFGGGSQSTLSDDDKTTRITLSESAEEGNYSLGDLVRITVVLKENPDALWLPPQAIRTFEGRKFVIIQNEGIQQRVDVKVGLEGEDRV